MASHFDLVTFDSPDPDEAATFWAAALALVESEREDGDRWIVLVDVTGVRRIGLQRGPVRPGTVHLDLSSDAPAGTIVRIIDALGTLIGEQTVQGNSIEVNLQNYPAGAYQLVLQGNSQRVIKL